MKLILMNSRMGMRIGELTSQCYFKIEKIVSCFDLIKIRPKERYDWDEFIIRVSNSLK